MPCLLESADLIYPSLAIFTVTAEPLVRLTDVNFAYDKRPILSGFNMQIPRGKVVAIMGISGGGKTTTLRLIGGQIKATSGEVVVAGQRVDQLDDKGLYALRRRMGMLFQFGALFTDLSVYNPSR